MATGSERPPRPRGVTLASAIGVVQGLLVVVVGLALATGRDDVELRRELDGDPGDLLVAGVAVTVVGVAFVVLALLLGRGSERVRSFFAVINGLSVAGSVYALIAQRDYADDRAWAFVLPLIVLWLLYGSRGTQEFFQR